MGFERMIQALADAVGKLGTLWLPIVVVFLAMSASTSHGTTIASVTLDELLTNSEFVFEGEVIESETLMNSESRLIHTCVTYQILDVIKGDNESDVITLCFLGGTFENIRMRIAQMRYPTDGEHGVYFVESLGRAQVNPIYGWQQGHFLIARDEESDEERVKTVTGRPVLELSLPTPAVGPRVSTGVARGIATADPASFPEALTVEEFKQGLRSKLKNLPR